MGAHYLLRSFVIVECLIRFFLWLDGDSRVCKRPRGGGQLRAAEFSACTPAAKNYVLLPLRENALFPVSDLIHLPGSMRFTGGVLILLAPHARLGGEILR